MAGSKFKIIERKNDCVLLMKKEGQNCKYMVKDIEGDVIHINYDNLELARTHFNDYDIAKVRKERRKIFEDWLKENAQA